MVMINYLGYGYDLSCKLYPKISRRVFYLIEFLRVKGKHTYTFRAIAREIAEDSPELRIKSGMQEHGYALCNAAMNFLNIDINNNNWN